MNTYLKASGLLFLFLTSMVAMGILSCTSQEESGSEFNAVGEVDQAVLDSIHAEITAGDYGLIDRFLVIQFDSVLADHRYLQDYETIASRYDTANFQYNYDHPDWHPYYRETDLHTLQSVTKSVTSAVLGIALAEHPEYNVNTNVMSLFPEFDVEGSDQRKTEIVLEDLLTMRSGLEWNEDDYNDAANDCIVLEFQDDWIAYVLNKPTDTVPGVAFEYNSGASVIIGKIVRIITGERIDKYAEEKLFGPLGITEYFWKETPLGEMDTEGGLYLSTESLAKIGKLFMNGGIWNGEQIVPASWVQISTSPVVADVRSENNPGLGYGYQWWVPKHENGETRIFAGNGYGGQFLFVVPEHELIVVFNGWNIHDSPEKSTWRVLQSRILPSLI